MGVLHDYFRAANHKAALGVLEAPAGPLVPDDTGRTPFDGIDAKGVDPNVVLGQLVAIVRNTQWTTETVTTTSVWPPPDTAPATLDEAMTLPEDSPWSTGPWVMELDDQTHATLADIADSQCARLAAQWAQIEEFDYDDGVEDMLTTLVADLSHLARRAREAGHRLYCWTCL